MDFLSIVFAPPSLVMLAGLALLLWSTFPTSLASRAAPLARPVGWVLAVGGILLREWPNHPASAWPLVVWGVALGWALAVLLLVVSRVRSGGRPSPGEGAGS
jgi:hypothetical protein